MQNCDLGIVENVYHVVVQCPLIQDLRYSMYNQLRGYVPAFSDKLSEMPQNIFPCLLGKVIYDLEVL